MDSSPGQPENDRQRESARKVRMFLKIYGAVLATIACACLVLLTLRFVPGRPRHALVKLERSPAASQPLSDGSWRFIVSGDSRNCGDVVMPAIAAHSAQFSPSFYWHLGDLRAIYKVDEDMAFAAAKNHQVLACGNYLRLAWSDFATNQIATFGQVPFYLGIGNHEVIPPKDETAFKRQFYDWLDLPVLKTQREKDNEPAEPEPYYHWIQGGVDFIYLDNASNSFSGPELTWLRNRLNNAEHNPDVLSVVVGMHEALPDSIADSHSMSISSDGRASGEEAYKDLEKFRDHVYPDGSRKQVYVLASHSHFYMPNIFNTDKLTDHGKKQPLSGWIIGTAGAVRYSLPKGSPETAETDVYGYLLGTVSAKGIIEFTFERVRESDVPQWVRERYPDAFVPWCFVHNSENKEPGAEDITPRCLPPKPSAPPAKGKSQ